MSRDQKPLKFGKATVPDSLLESAKYEKKIEQGKKITQFREIE